MYFGSLEPVSIYNLSAKEIEPSKSLVLIGQLASPKYSKRPCLKKKNKVEGG